MPHLDPGAPPRPHGGPHSGPVRRVAWFRPAPGHEEALDDTAALAHELGRAWRIELFDAGSAADFVWMHARDPYDVCVYELADSRAHAFVWPYVFHYPGVLRLRSATLARGRAAALHRIRRFADFTREVEFGGPDLLRAPGEASRLVVVSDGVLAARLRREGLMRIREVPLGIGTPAAATHPSPAPIVRFGLAAPSRLDVARRAIQRARTAGALAELVAGAPPAEIVQESDVVLALEWPPATSEPPMAALAGMAQARAVIVLETAGTARWPALDPQTWRPRDLIGSGPPAIVVSADPRDEEHSLTLAIRRLASDPALVRRLGDAGNAWWLEHATLAHAAAAWDAALHEAVSVETPVRPEGWPPHLASDATSRAREILNDLRVGVDFLK